MSWLDSALGSVGIGNSGGSSGPDLSQLSPRQLNWFITHGIDPRSLSTQQLGIALNTMQTQFTQEDQQAQAKAQADADAAARADALRRQQEEAQAQQAAAEKAAADAEAARKATIPTPTPAPTPTPTPTPDPTPVAPTPVAPIDIAPTTVTSGPDTPQGFTLDDVNQRIADAVSLALSQQADQFNTRFQDQANQAATDRAAAIKKAQDDAAAAAAAANDANTQRLAGLRNATTAGTTAGINSYFRARGVDPSQYSQSIIDAVNNAMSGVSATDENPSSRVDVTGIASKLYGDAQTARQGSFTSQLAQMFPETYANTRVGNNADDDIINAILGEQRTNANNIVNNMLKRGVITQTGADAAFADLDKQTPLARVTLNQIGSDLLGGERSNINDIIARANKAASTVGLNSTFDPTAYTNEINNSFNDFMASLNDKTRAAAPGNLFTTSNLGTIAGAASGAQNTQFNPNALAGVLAQQTGDNTDTTGKNTTPSSKANPTSFVF